ncbi:MAG: MCE family protein [Bacteroidales bacterium]|nr:MCE family protein [Candidatus Colicola caccequi]
MKYKREIKVAVLAIVCIFLLVYGMNFLKGRDIFSPVKHYVGVFDNVSGLVAQAPVYVRGYKVGQVDAIRYDFTSPHAFTVVISMDKNIAIQQPAEMRLCDDGLLGGKAIEVEVPIGSTEGKLLYAEGDTIPAVVVVGLLETLQEGFMAKVDEAIVNLDSLIVKVNAQVGDNTLKRTLSNVEQISDELSASARDIRAITHHQLPSIMLNADSAINDAKVVIRDLKTAEISQTVTRVNTMVDSVNTILTSKHGTLGLLLNDKNLYQHIDSTVVSVDNLVVDLKANPKKYVHFSLFGGKDKSDKKTKEK